MEDQKEKLLRLILLEVVQDSMITQGTLKNNRTRRQELKTSVIELASQAASRAMAEAAKNITPPNTAYQFEVSWRGFSGDRALQTHLLKVTSPSALPQIFKNALSVPILIDIIKCVASFFIDDMDLAVKYLENLSCVFHPLTCLVSSRSCFTTIGRRRLNPVWQS
ncbi:hypothetical protein OIU84_006862 [Salix udensis]|uniref:RNA-polymerase II-associated protein 3-like C-terminal domain-containing protein n=1 Tax=Salix udensis TaxID=889485 RepID=A0AAD6K1L9_9ROSI|nr:hypothetical protein OIU84_006862 [Salix udensis]